LKFKCNIGHHQEDPDFLNLYKTLGEISWVLVALPSKLIHNLWAKQNLAGVQAGVQTHKIFPQRKFNNSIYIILTMSGTPQHKH